jgi:hypothetical protein
VETYTREKPLVFSPSYDSERRKSLEGLRTEISRGAIDEPTMDIVERFARMEHCYTLQSCYGHFMAEHCVDDRNTSRVAEIKPRGDSIHYRIEYIQFGCAEWFWRTCVNSYVLQVSPLRNAHQDHFDVSIEEALRIEQTRDRFYERLREARSIR